MNLQIAEAAAEATRAAGAEIRLLRAAETAPEAGMNGQETWKDPVDKMTKIPLVTADDKRCAAPSFQRIRMTCRW